MSTAKTKVDAEHVLSFLQKHFSPDITHLEFIKGGELSQAFFFDSKGDSFVIRINKNADGFKKDKYAYEHFNSKKIPIPKTISMGKFNDNLCFSTTERIPGKILEKFNTEETMVFIPSLIETLGAIHALPLSDKKYGPVDIHGKAKENGWKEYLRKFSEEDNTNPETYKDHPFLESDAIAKLMEKFHSLIEYCPEYHYLIHADFGFSNALSDGKKITGIIDWDQFSHGDFLYDVAWLSFWSNNIDYKTIFYNHYKKTVAPIENFEERILAYKLHFGMGALFFFADSEQEGSYKYTKEKLLSLL